MSSPGARGERPVGQVADGSWEAGARRTLTLDLSEAWDLVTSPSGMGIWLGEVINLRIGTDFRLRDGVTGRVTVLEPRSHLRLTWQPVAWRSPSRLQLRTIPARGATTVAFHHERLPSGTDRQLSLERWHTVLDRLGELVSDPQR